MRKILSLVLAVVLMSSVSFGQSNLRKGDIANTRTVHSAIAHQTTNHSINAALLEDFNASTTIPVGWETSVDNPWKIEDDGSGTDNRCFFDMWNYASGNEGTITTPSLSITSGDATMTFDLEYFLIGGDYGDAGELYIAVSDDNGSTWNEDATNVIAGTAGNAAVVHSVDFTAFNGTDYTGSTVKVRFRGVSDYGSYNIKIDNFAGPQIAIPPVPDLQVTGTLSEVYTILPSAQVMAITPASTVVNAGSELTDATNVDFAVTGQSYTDASAITVPMANGITETVTAGSAFTPTANGTYEFTYEASISNDFDPSNNTDSKTITITDDVLSYSNGVNAGQLGASSGAMLGNKFVFNTNDDLTGVSFHITAGATAYDCTVKVYEFTGNTLGNLLAETGTISVTDQDAIYTEDFMVPVSVTAGQEVLIVVDNLAAASFMSLGTDTRYVADKGWASTDGTTFSEMASIGFPNLFELNAILATVIPVNDNVAMVSINTPVATTPSNIDITGTVRNLGNQGPLTSFDVVYTIDGGAASAVYNVTGVSIAPGATYDFTHNVQWTATTGQHTIEVTLTNPNGNTDEDASDNVMSKNILVVNEVFAKNVVYEEGTGTWCGWCVRGLVGLNTMAHNITDGTWIGIGVHNGDPMTVTAYDAAIGGYIGGYPSGIIDRHSTEVDPGLSSLEPAYQAQLLETPVAKIDITSQTWNTTTRNFTVEVATTFALDITNANYNTALIVVENGVSGTTDEWRQHDYYQGGGYGAMTDWDGFDYTVEGTIDDGQGAGYVPAANMVYNHVGRQLVDGWAGTALSAADVTYNVAITHSYSGSIPADNNENNTEYVAIVIDNATGEIVNATAVNLDLTSGLKQVNSNSKFNVYPNPTTGLVKVEGVEGAQVIVYNMIGEAVYTEANASATTTIDLSSFNAGNYIVKIINNNEVATQKIVLTK